MKRKKTLNLAEVVSVLQLLNYMCIAFMISLMSKNFCFFTLIRKNQENDEIMNLRVYLPPFLKR